MHKETQTELESKTKEDLDTAGRMMRGEKENGLKLHIWRYGRTVSSGNFYAIVDLQTVPNNVCTLQVLITYIKNGDRVPVFPSDVTVESSKKHVAFSTGTLC